jgi:hypothetical protein
MLGELLAAAVNANVGAWKLSPMATEMESQVIRWLAQFIDYPSDCGGLLVSGGNMANLTCFLAARAAQAGWDVRKQGVSGGPRLRAYAATEAHTWIQKAADIAGLGTDAIAWIGVDKQQRLDLAALEIQYKRDLEEGYQPFIVVGSAGTVSTALWIRCRSWRISVKSTACGFTSTVPTGLSLPAFRGRLPISWDCRWPIPSPWIRINGCTRRSKPGAPWSAIRPHCATHSRITRPTTALT